MKLTKKLTVAIKAVAVLRSSLVSMNAKQIAEAVGSTPTFLAQIMRNLRENGIVNVKRGPGGGYVLNPESGLVTALRISQAVGNGFNSVTEENTPTERLYSSIVQAFSNTSV